MTKGFSNILDLGKITIAEQNKRHSVKQNILFTCAGRRNYLINYFKEALNGHGNVIAVDQDLLAPALVDADIALQAPDIYNKSYTSKLLKICKDHNVTAIISLNDLELPILSKNKSLFEQVGVKVLVSSESVIDIGFDKLKTFNFLKELDISTPKTFISIDEALQAIQDGELKFPLVLKPRWGSASIGVEFPESIEELELSYKLLKIKLPKSILGKASKNDIKNSILIQEKLIGREFGLDIVNDFEGNYFGTFAREKLAMRSGETDKALSIIDNRISELGEKLAKALKHIGNMDCDAFLVNGTYHLLEINPRFGGGYPFSHESGLNLAKIYLEWLKGEPSKSLTQYNNFKDGLIFSKCDRLLKINNPKKYVGKTIELITLEKDWKAFLGKVGNYDFYHTYNYHVISKLDNETPILLKYEADDVIIGLPLLSREIFNTTYKDATSVYGYVGPVSKGITENFDNSNYIKALSKFFKKHKYVSVFSRLNPYIPNQFKALENIGSTSHQGKVVNLDLDLDLEKQRTLYGSRLKTHVNKARRLCSVRKAETDSDLQCFIDIYHENMDRVKAKRKYYFNSAYFEDLIKSNDFKTTVLLAIDNESGCIIAGSMFIITNGIAQYHLSGSKKNSLNLYATKFLIDEMRILAYHKGCNFFNLGGGLGGHNDDSLFEFKASFSKDFKDFNLWKYIVNQAVYDELVIEKGIINKSEFFPLYRSLDDLTISS